MKNKKELLETTGKLIKAYMDDNLEAGKCSKCAVGNLCGGWDKWIGLFYPNEDGTVNYPNFLTLTFWSEEDTKDTVEKELLQKIPHYSIEQIAKIEKVFETSSVGNSEEEKQYNGLKAVFELLCDFHECDVREKKELIDTLDKAFV